jgi:BolA protein
MSEVRVEQIRQRLQQALEPQRLDVVDESALHAGHPGARDGRGHFRVRIDAPALIGLPRLAAHRRIYQALGDLMVTDIHALSIELESD